MIRALTILALLGACTVPSPPVEPEPPAAVEKGMVVVISKTGLNARTLIEELAARCWLDGIVRGAALVVDRQSGRIVIDGDDENLIVAEFLPPRDGRSHIWITGPATDNPETALRIAQSVDKAEKTGETACPIASG